MSGISAIIIFLIFSILIITPYLTFMLFQTNLKQKKFEKRISNVRKPYKKLLETISPLIIEKENAATLSKPLVFSLLGIILLLPALIIVLVIDSFFSSLMAITIYAAFVGVIYVLYNKMQQRKQIAAFVNDMPNAIDLIIRSLKAGRTITDAMATVGDESKGPVAEQFKNITSQLILGKDFLSVTRSVGYQLKIPEFSFFVLVLSVQQETGGNIIKTLSSLSEMLRQRLIMQRKIKSLSSEGIFSAFFMGGLPFLVAGIITLIRPEYISLMFTTSTGNNLLIAGIISEFLGCLMIARLVRIEV